MKPTTMPFGKFKGKPLSSLKLDYVNWLLSDFEGLRAPLRRDLEAELRRRGTGDQADREPGDEPPEEDSEPHPPARTSTPASAPASGQGRPAMATSTTEDRVRRLVRLEVAAILQRMARALERENK